MNNKTNPTSLMEIFDELLDKLELPSDSKCYETNEFFYEKINPDINWETDVSTNISKLALRTIIEKAYIAGKKEAYENAYALTDAWVKSYGTLRKLK